jgi:glycosyltransferase involved in cell wall biosynthesis
MAKPVRIAYLSSTYPRASDTFVRTEIEQLRRIGFHVETFSIRRPSREQIVSEAIRVEAEKTTNLLSEGVLALPFAVLATACTAPARFLRALWLGWRAGSRGVDARLRQIAYFCEAARLAREMRRLDVRHLHNHIAENSATVAMLASQMSGIPYSMTVHGPGIFFRPEQWALGEKIVRSAFTACISDFCKSQCMIFAPPDAWEQLKLIRCGVDESLIEAPIAAIPSEPRVVCVGRLCPEKGQALLIEAAHRLRQEGVTFEIELVGEGETREQLQALIRRYDLGDRVHLSGWVSSSEVFEKIRAARALVLPSFAEGLPVVLMEAMALGRPVIATSIAGIGELVQDGVSGWLVAPSSTPELTEAMRKVFTADPQELERMGRDGARRVQQQHNAAVEAKELANCILAGLSPDDDEKEAK